MAHVKCQHQINNAIVADFTEARRGSRYWIGELPYPGAVDRVVCWSSRRKRWCVRAMRSLHPPTGAEAPDPPENAGRRHSRDVVTRPSRNVSAQLDGIALLHRLSMVLAYSTIDGVTGMAVLNADHRDA